MKGMIDKKAFLVGCIFLLATFMLAQLSWGCDDKDKRDGGHHDKGHCDHQGDSCHPPKIQRVFLDYQADSIVFEIWGNNFNKGAPPVVTLGGIYDLTIDKALTNDNVITATLSSLKDKEFEFGDYRLLVSTCQDSACENKYCKDHGPNCKCKYCKEHCSKYKNRDSEDNEYKCRCKDRYSLTIPGPSTPPGTIALKIESETVELPFGEIEKKMVAEVKCKGGLGVTGGGFSCSNTNACADGLRIVVSEPLQDDKNNGIGWHIIATYAGPPAQLTIRAICAQVQ